MKICGWLLIIGLLFSSAAGAKGLRDPRLRDEDISGLGLATKIDKLPNGNYKYTYTITSPASASGDVLDFYLDINCPNMPDIGEQHIDDAGYTREYNRSADGRHVPLQSSIVGLSQKIASITRDNLFVMLVNIPPGQSRSVSLLSRNRPGNLRFKTTVSAAQESAYDYLDETGERWKYSMESMPWYPDWEVHGIVKGPTCPEDAATPLTRPIFNGQRMPEELRETDRLLNYEVKGNRNRWHELATVTEVKLRIYYGYGISAPSLVAQLNGRDITTMLHPEEKKGAYEDITLPLEGAVTKLKLVVCDASEVNSDGSFPPKSCDEDHFEIRRPLP